MDYTYDPEVLWIAAKIVISPKNSIDANSAYKYDLWNNEMLVFTVHYRARLLRITLAEMAGPGEPTR